VSRKPVLILKHGKLPLGHLTAALEKANVPYEICQTGAGEVPPEDMDSIAGIVMMGGMMGVYEQDKYPWLSREIGWVDRFIETGKPVFGICLGCQILSHIYDGEVYSGEKGLSVGFKPIELVDDDPVFGSELEGCHVPLFHGDTYDLPETAERMVRGFFYYEQAARFAENVYGVQFHPEATAEVVRCWYDYGQSDPRFPQDVAFEEFITDAEKRLPATQHWLEQFIGRLFG